MQLCQGSEKPRNTFSLQHNENGMVDGLFTPSGGTATQTEVLTCAAALEGADSSLTTLYSFHNIDKVC